MESKSFINSGICILYTNDNSYSTITPSAIKTSTTQRGQGLKYEGIMRMTWIALNAPETFWKNITLFIAVGSWKDIILMLSYDIQQNGWIRRN